MRIFADFHHMGAARAQVLLFAKRLGHEVWFPDESFSIWACELVKAPGTWNMCDAHWLQIHGGCDELLDAQGRWPFRCSREQFLAQAWDAVLISRHESQPIVRQLLADHPQGARIKRLGMTGNCGTCYDWALCNNLLTSDLSSYYMSPAHLHKLHYSQEIGPQYGAKFVAVTEADLLRVHTMVNWLANYRAPYAWRGDIDFYGACPHCGCRDRSPGLPFVPADWWAAMKTRLPGHTFEAYGAGNSGGAFVERELPAKYYGCALTAHPKPADGYGFSLLQSIACGRPVLVLRNLHRYRTAGRYLIEGLTSFSFSFEHPVDEAAEVIRHVTRNVATANEYARACWEAGRGLFNWGHEAARVKDWLDALE